MLWISMDIKHRLVLFVVSSVDLYGLSRCLGGKRGWKLEYLLKMILLEKAIPRTGRAVLKGLWGDIIFTNLKTESPQQSQWVQRWCGHIHNNRKWPHKEEMWQHTRQQMQKAALCRCWSHSHKDRYIEDTCSDSANDANCTDLISPEWWLDTGRDSAFLHLWLWLWKYVHSKECWSWSCLPCSSWGLLSVQNLDKSATQITSWKEQLEKWSDILCDLFARPASCEQVPPAQEVLRSSWQSWLWRPWLPDTRLPDFSIRLHGYQASAVRHDSGLYRSWSQGVWTHRTCWTIQPCLYVSSVKRREAHQRSSCHEPRHVWQTPSGEDLRWSPGQWSPGCPGEGALREWIECSTAVTMLTSSNILRFNCQLFTRLQP